MTSPLSLIMVQSEQPELDVDVSLWECLTFREDKVCFQFGWTRGLA